MTDPLSDMKVFISPMRQLQNAWCDHRCWAGVCNKLHGSLLKCFGRYEPDDNNISSLNNSYKIVLLPEAAAAACTVHDLYKYSVNRCETYREVGQWL